MVYLLNAFLECFGYPVYPFASYSYEWSFSFSGAKGVWLVLVVVIACVSIFFSWQSLRKAKSLPKRIMLFSIRLITVVLIVLMVMQSGIDVQKFEKLNSSVVVMVDDSVSMSIINSDTKQGRADEVLQFIRKSGGYFDKLEKEFDVQYFTFSKDVQKVTRLELENGLKVDGNRTDIGRVLNYLSENYEKEEVKACLIFSDGVDNAAKGSTDFSQLNKFNKLTEQLQTPLYTFSPSNPGVVRDISIKDMEYDKYAFVRNESKIRVIVNVDGFGNESVPVTLKEGKSLISSKLIKVVPGVRAYAVDFEVTPDSAGSHVYSVSIPFFKDEVLKLNNLKEFSLLVIRDKIRVLHLCGRPSWDLRFLRRMLKQVHNIDLISFYILKTSEDVSLVPNSEMSLIPFPIDELFTKTLNSFDLVIFQDFDYRPFNLSGNIFNTYFENLKRHVVESGGAFLMIGGDFSFSSGAYQNTQLQDILPVHLESSEGDISNDSFKAMLTTQGQMHPVASLVSDRDNNLNVWKHLPLLHGCNKVGLVKEGSVPIAEHSGLSVNGTKMPVIAAGVMGKGRSMAIMTDSLWKWDFMASSEGGTNRYYLQFWNNAIKWLTRDPSMSVVNVSTDKRVYSAGEDVKIEITAFDTAYKPIKNGDVNLNLIRVADGVVKSSTSLKSDENGLCYLDLKPGGAGFYKVEVDVDYTGGGNGSNYVVFKVEPVNREFEDIGINDGVLTGLAEQSGGRFFKLPLSANLKDVLELQPINRVQLLGKKKYSLWDNWVIFAILVIALGAEWWLRLKEGLT